MRVRWIREFLSFSGKERTGIIGLLLIIFLLIVIGKLIPCFINHDNAGLAKWEAEVNSYLAKTANKNSVATSLHPVTFNPNEVDSISLVNMGLPLNVVSNWVRYLKKGASFRDKEGVKRIYGMTSDLFEQLDSFIEIPSGTSFVKKGSGISEIKSKPYKGFHRDTIFSRTLSKREKTGKKSQELNSTDSVHLVEIPGIGPVLASRIIRYRNLLGGYYSISQLKEVYGLREENFIEVSQYFTVDQSAIKTFNINLSTIQEIGHHPYVGYKSARRIFKFRDKTGKFSSPDDLSSVMTSDSLNRLIPYLRFSQ